MSRIYIDFTGLEETATKCKKISSDIKDIQDTFSNTIKNLDWDIRYESDINKKSSQIARELDNYSKILIQYQRFLIEVKKKYRQIDSHNADFEQLPAIKDTLERFLYILHGKFDWKKFLSEAGYIGTIFNLADDIMHSKTWYDIFKNGKKVYNFLDEARKTYKNYAKIGNAVGADVAKGWWYKKILGLKPLGRASTAKNPFARFKNNLFNKTSPFNAQIKEVFKNFKGANGAGKAIAAWAGVAITGVSSWFSNKEEQVNSNGTMSDSRVIAETISETAVETALVYGTGIVVGAAVTAAIGTTAAPAILVAGLSCIVTAGINAGVETFTGQTATEWISDGVLDVGESIGNVGTNVLNATNSWFNQINN